MRQRSPLVLAIGAALAFVALLVIQQLVVHGGLAAVDEGRLLRTSHDDFIHVSHRIAELRDKRSDSTTIYLLGGSGTMECIVSESSLASQIGTRLDGTVRVVSLAAAQESMAMSLTLVDNLPPGPAIVVVGVSPIRMIGDPGRDAKILAGDPLLMSSPSLAALSPAYFDDEGIRRRALVTGILAYVGSYLRSRQEEGIRWGSKITYATHYFPKGAKGRLPLAKRLDVLSVLADHKRRFEKYGAYNLALLRQILELGAKRGYRMVVFDQPLNVSAGGPDWAGVVPAYRAAVRQLAAEHDVPYLHTQRHVDLADDDFADLFHLLAPARLKWQPQLAREIASAVEAPQLDVVSHGGPTGSRGAMR